MGIEDMRLRNVYGKNSSVSKLKERLESNFGSRKDRK